MSAEDITAEELENATKSFVSIESATQISRRYVRKKLEEIFNLEENALYERKKEINEIVEKVLTNLLEEENKKKNDELHVKEEDMNSIKTNDAGDTNSVQGSSSKRSSNQQGKTEVERIKNESNNDDKSSCSQSDSNDKGSSKKRKKSGNETLSARKKQANVMTKDYFLDNAKPLCCNISENIKLKLEPRIFSTGSCGWHMMDKIYLLVGDHNVLCQLCINCSASNGIKYIPKKDVLKKFNESTNNPMFLNQKFCKNKTKTVHTLKHVMILHQLTFFLTE